jgi:hypothetical protein
MAQSAPVPDSMTSSEDEDVVRFTSKLSVLYPGKSPVVDIVAVENLSDRMLHCWRCQTRGCEVVWLRDSAFLPHEIPASRVFSFGYILTDNFDLSALGNDLLRKLASERSEQEVLTLVSKPFAYLY